MSWVLVVTHDLQAIGSRFLVDTTFCDNVICDLKMKVKEKWKVDLAHVDAECLTVWKLKGKNIINSSNSSIKCLAEILGNINIDDKDTVEELNTSVKAADLALPPDETLLVRVPAVVSNEDHSLRVGDPVASKVGSKYKDCFLLMHIRGDFIEEDMNSNDIVAAYIVPDFVKKYEEILGRKRKLADDDSEMLAKAEPFVGKAAWEKYFDNLTADQEMRFPANKHEINHLIHISSVDVENSWDPLMEGSPRHFKEDDANWLFFYAIAHHFRSLHSNIASDGTLKTIVKLGQESWPFWLVTQVGKDCFTYIPKNDFLVLKFGLPRVTVEVNSNPPSKPPVDFYRLMLQAASVVRFANTFIDVYKEKKTFILVAIFVGHTGLSHRYIFYQRRDSRTVYHKRRSFRLSKEGDRIEFALELYNIASALENESDSESGDTKSRVRELTAGVDKLSQDHGMPEFTSDTKCTVSDDRENQPGPSVCPKGDARGANEQLEASVYQVVPDVFETDGGTWELIVKPPPHIHTVYRQSDPNKTELIAKHLCEGSNELHILKWPAAPFSVAANALVDRGKEPRPRQDMVEESMKPPEAKKPRLAGD